VASLEYILENPIVAEVAERTQCAEEAASTDQPSELSMPRVIPAAEGHKCILLCLSAVMDIFCSGVSDTSRGRRKGSALVQAAPRPSYIHHRATLVDGTSRSLGGPFSVLLQTTFKLRTADNVLLLWPLSIERLPM